MDATAARAVLTDFIKNVDFVNLGRTIGALESGLTWKTFDNSKWRPDKSLALNEIKWLQQHVESLVTALQTLKDTNA
jgi:hypothetical protein